MSPSIEEAMDSRSPSMVEVMFLAIEEKKEPMEVGVEPEEVVVVGIRTWPRVEVLSWEGC